MANNDAITCGRGYACGSYHRSEDECKMNDDYFFFWSLKRFCAYFEDGVLIEDDPEEESDPEEENDSIAASEEEEGKDEAVWSI